VLDTIFPVHLSETISREQFYRQEIAIERMEKRMKHMEETIESLKQEKVSSSEKIRTLTQEKEDLQEEFYDCQAELIQQKEYVVILQAEEVIRKKRMQQHIQKIKEYTQKTNLELEGIEQTLTSLMQSPYKVCESLNHMNDRKNTLLKQKQTYVDLLGFLE
jgi:uncharacterized protein YlxW (UPF0749 family)